MMYRIGFVMEQTLGHVTHAQNFRKWIERDPDVVATWIPVSFTATDRWRYVPNWTVRSSLRARSELNQALRSVQFDALFFHTQVTALFAQGLMARIPTVVSLDATPLNFDRIGDPYNHKPSASKRVEALKNALNRRTFNRARKLISWHEWGKQSLVEDYGIDGTKVLVIPPGIDHEHWSFPRHPSHGGGKIRLLFVGGDFRRKGGEVLLAAFQRSLVSHCTLDIVTREQVKLDGLTGVTVHHGLGPNAPELLALYAQADVFVFPTFADTLPLVVQEALSSSLPVITTRVGALHEEVDDGVTGFLVPPNEVEPLAQAVMRLVDNPALRFQMGAGARQAAERKFNASRNYPRVLDVCKSCVDQNRLALNAR